MDQIRRLQNEIQEWSTYNWGAPDTCPPIIAVVGLGEEVGEVQRAILKQHQGIRGTWDEWQEEIAKELGDVFIKIVDVAVRAGLDMSDCVENRWKTIQQRDWRKDKVQHGIG